MGVCKSLEVSRLSTVPSQFSAASCTYVCLIQNNQLDAVVEQLLRGGKLFDLIADDLNEANSAC